MHHGGAKQHNKKLALVMEPSILVNSTGMRWHHICLPTKSYFVVDVDDQAVCDVDAESC
jgi:hypothetical protein